MKSRSFIFFIHYITGKPQQVNIHIKLKKLIAALPARHAMQPIILSALFKLYLLHDALRTGYIPVLFVGLFTMPNPTNTGSKTFKKPFTCSLISIPANSFIKKTTRAAIDSHNAQLLNRFK